MLLPQNLLSAVLEFPEVFLLLLLTLSSLCSNSSIGWAWVLFVPTDLSSMDVIFLCQCTRARVCVLNFLRDGNQLSGKSSEMHGAYPLPDWETHLWFLSSSPKCHPRSSFLASQGQKQQTPS